MSRRVPQYVRVTLANPGDAMFFAAGRAVRERSRRRQRAGKMIVCAGDLSHRLVTVDVERGVLTFAWAAGGKKP